MYYIWHEVDIYKMMQAFADANKLTANLKIIRSTGKESGVSELHKDGLTDLIVVARTHKSTFFKRFNQGEQANIVNHVYAPIFIY